MKGELMKGEVARQGEIHAKLSAIEEISIMLGETIEGLKSRLKPVLNSGEEVKEGGPEPDPPMKSFSPLGMELQKQIAFLIMANKRLNWIISKLEI